MTYSYTRNSAFFIQTMIINSSRITFELALFIRCFRKVCHLLSVISTERQRVEKSISKAKNKVRFLHACGYAALSRSLILCAIWWFVKAKNNIIGNVIFALILIATLIWTGPVIYLTLYAAASHRLFIEAFLISLLILAWFVVTCVTNHKRRVLVCNQ